jgi:hypothetical protein
MHRSKQPKTKKVKTTRKKVFVTNIQVKAGEITFTPEDIISKDEAYKEKMDAMSPVNPEFMKLAGKRASAHKIIQALEKKNKGLPLFTEKTVMVTDEESANEDEDEDVLMSDDESVSSSEHSFQSRHSSLYDSAVLSHYINSVSVFP